MSLSIGIDVSKDHFDIASNLGSQTERVPHNTAGIRKIVRSLKQRKPQRIIIEATAGLERSLLHALADAQLPVILVNPLQTRRFAEAMGTLAKTDSIDAKVLALFGDRLRPTPRPIPNRIRRQLALYIARRRQITGMITGEKNRRHSAPTFLRRSIDAHIRFLNRQLATIDDRIDKLLDDPLYHRVASILQSVPSVGPVTAKTLIIDLPELGTLSRKQIAALVGLAPIPRDSGRKSGKRSIRAGRASVRTTLFLCAMNAARFNPVLKNFYLRLRTAGKPPKVAFIAVAHKLLIILNAMMRNQSSWQHPEAVSS